MDFNQAIETISGHIDMIYNMGVITPEEENKLADAETFLLNYAKKQEVITEAFLTACKFLRKYSPTDACEMEDIIPLIYWQEDDPAGTCWAAHFLKQAENKIYKSPVV